MSSNSIMHRMSEFEFLVEETQRLDKELDKRRKLLASLPQECKHEIIIHFGIDDFRPEKKNIISDFLYCPLCGKTNFKLAINPNGQSFVLCKNVPVDDARQKLSAIQRILRMGLQAYGNKKLPDVLEKLKKYYALKHYRVKIL